MKQDKIPRYATLFYEVRQQLGITWSEYVLLEMVYHLSFQTGFCFKTPSQMAEDIGVTKRAINKMIIRLTEKGYLHRHEDNSLQVKKKYYDIQTIYGGK